jgi:putative restriction endonuclease
MRDIFCAVTDNDWFDYLRVRPSLPEINFWKPTPQTFKAVGEGGIFAFKLKAPYNKIGGFGVLTTSADAQINTTWQAFGEGNGVPDLETFVTKIRTIKKSPDVNQYSFIGVRVLVHHVFFPEELWFDPPNDWSTNIVQGKTYSTDTMLGQNLLRELELRAGGFPEAIAPRHSFPGLAAEPQAGYGAEIPVRPRIGQGTFRINVARAYQNECVLSETRVTPALEAAHIKPFALSQSHAIQNGILLRKDIHSVFDAGFATFDEQRRFVVSPQVKIIFNNGHEYRRLHGKCMRDPINLDWLPSQEFLAWHRENKYVGD